MRTIQQEHIWHEEPVQVKRGDVWTLGMHRLMCGDSTNAEDVATLMQGESADLIFADPPYGIGIDTWDIALTDVPAFIALVTANLKHGGFFAFTHQMPYMVEWLHALQHTQLTYKDHVAWVKRMATTPGAALMRSHENLFIYGNGKARYHVTRGRYTDVKVPGLLYDVVSIEGIKTYINDLHAKLRGDIHRRRTTPPDSQYPGYKGYQGTPQSSDRSDEFANFTNVWSFLPEYQHHYPQTQQRHPTSKPVLLLERLLELCTPENALVVDMFLGSGTTLIAGENTGRTVYGIELSEQYCHDIIQRWQAHTGRLAVQA